MYMHTHTGHDGTNYMDRRQSGYIYLSVCVYKNICEYIYVYVRVYAHTGNGGTKCTDRKWAGCIYMSIYVCEYMWIYTYIYIYTRRQEMTVQIARIPSRYSFFCGECGLDAYTSIQIWLGCIYFLCMHIYICTHIYICNHIRVYSCREVYAYT